MIYRKCAFSLFVSVFTLNLWATSPDSLENKNPHKKRRLEVTSSDSSQESDSKKRRLSTNIKHASSQIYAFPTYDATFKHIMSDKEICLSFLKTFIPDENITSIDTLDTHLRPFKGYHKARTFINSDHSKKVITKINDLVEDGTTQDSFYIGYDNKEDKEENFLTGGGEFIKSLADIYGDLLKTYPKPARNSQVDLICKTNDGHYALVEVQVIPQDFWDERTLGYAASIYARQLREGDQWGEIKKVVCVNILGGGPLRKQWNTHTGFRRLTFKDQTNQEIENGIVVLQYPLYHEKTKKHSENLPTEEAKTAFKEWLDFFEDASSKKEEQVKLLKTKEVKKAYEKIREDTLPSSIKEELENQWKEIFAPYSQHTESLVGKAKEEEKINNIKGMLGLGVLTVDQIANAAGVDEDFVKGIQEEISK